MVMVGKINKRRIHPIGRPWPRQGEISHSEPPAWVLLVGF